jgi:AcrR family transcriptional regulator
MVVQKRETSSEVDVARRHGWGGSPPADDDEAGRRILEAAMRCVDRDGPECVSLAQVAAELGVIRQTVYRYYPSTEALFTAVGRLAVEDFIDELAEHLGRITEPADWFVEALATAIERLPQRPYLTLLLATGRTDPFTRGVTSPEAMAVGREVFKRSTIDWPAAGYDAAAIDDLIELMLRLIQSILVDPPPDPRTPRRLRSWLRRWLAPALRTST